MTSYQPKHKSRLTFIIMSSLLVAFVFSFPRPSSAATTGAAAFTIIDSPKIRRTAGGGCKEMPIPKTITPSRRTMTRNNKRNNDADTATKLQMVLTKSGGRAILSNEQFQDEVVSSETKKPILAYYSAPWCGPCRLSNPIVKEIIKEFVPDIDVVEICTDDLPEVAESAGITSIPSIQIYIQGKVADVIVGCVAKNVLSSAVKKILDDYGLTATNDADSSSHSSSSDDKKGDN